MSIPTPITPGDLLAAEFLDPMGITQYRLAKEIRVPAQRISEIVAGKRAIAARLNAPASMAPSPAAGAPRRPHPASA